MATDRLNLLLDYFREDPNDAFTRFALATEYLKRGDTHQGLRFFEELVGDDPLYVGTYYHLGKLYEQLSRKADAIQTYQAGIQVATRINDLHARAELQSALLEAEGLGFDDE